MNPMLDRRGMTAAVCLVGCIAAIAYSQIQHIPGFVAIPVAAAFLLEITLYVNVEPSARFHPGVLLGSALLPYLIYSFGTGTFRLPMFTLLAVLAAIAVGWFEVLPRHASVDLLFLAFMGAVYLFKVFRQCYPEPIPDLRVDSLGQLMWIRLGVASFLRAHGGAGIGFGFLPRVQDWRIGLSQYVQFLPVGTILVLILEYPAFGVPDGFWWKAALAFAGILWVVGLAEEFAFRGILQPRLVSWFGTWAGVLVASLLFGMVHLWFRNQFPNWKHVVLATALGVFCGRAYQQGKAIRASMVTHACVVATWRALFS
jgi:membrane protease YdiL (CAAX protease family)